MRVIKTGCRDLRVKVYVVRRKEVNIKAGCSCVCIYRLLYQPVLFVSSNTMKMWASKYYVVCTIINQTQTLS